MIRITVEMHGSHDFRIEARRWNDAVMEQRCVSEAVAMRALAAWAVNVADEIDRVSRERGL